MIAQVSTRDGRNDALSTDLAKVASEVCDCLRKAALICYTDVVEDVKARSKLCISSLFELE